MRAREDRRVVRLERLVQVWLYAGVLTFSCHLERLFEALYAIFNELLVHLLDVFFIKWSHLRRLLNQAGALGVIDAVALVVVSDELLLTLVPSPSVWALLPMSQAVHDLVIRALQHGHCHSLSLLVFFSDLVDRAIRRSVKLL